MPQPADKPVAHLMMLAWKVQRNLREAMERIHSGEIQAVIAVNGTSSSFRVTDAMYRHMRAIMIPRRDAAERADIYQRIRPSIAKLYRDNAGLAYLMKGGKALNLEDVFPEEKPPESLDGVDYEHRSFKIGWGLVAVIRPQDRSDRVVGSIDGISPISRATTRDYCTQFSSGDGPFVSGVGPFAEPRTTKVIDLDFDGARGLVLSHHMPGHHCVVKTSLEAARQSVVARPNPF